MAANARVSGLSALLLMAAFLLIQNLTFVSPSPALRAQRSVTVFRQATASADTAEKVAEVIAEQLGVEKDKVTREATLSELGADSLDIVESVMALEEAFDIELPDEETTPLKNCGDVMDLIQSKL
ncbi:acpP [Symbiodinium sp. CCMP2456]|nr:acpP [Symbiodinium sp. CCMP2456]